MTPGFLWHVGDRRAQNTQVLARVLGRAGGWHAQKGVPMAIAERGIWLCWWCVALLPREATACQDGSALTLRRCGVRDARR